MIDELINSIRNFLLSGSPIGICPNISKKQRYDNGHEIREEQVGILRLLEQKKMGGGRPIGPPLKNYWSFQVGFRFSRKALRPSVASSAITDA